MMTGMMTGMTIGMMIGMIIDLRTVKEPQGVWHSKVEIKKSK